jgi:hypothetical protein
VILGLPRPLAIDLGIPAAAELFDRRHVDAPVVEIAVELAHVLVEEPAVDADAVAAQRGNAGRGHVAPDVLEHLRLRGGNVDRCLLDLDEEPRLRVHLADEVVHAGEGVGRLVHDKVDAVVDRDEFGVGNDARDLDDRVLLDLEAGHLEVDPYEPVVRRACHERQASEGSRRR